jgi:hypothetical protein
MKKNFKQGIISSVVSSLFLLLVELLFYLNPIILGYLHQFVGHPSLKLIQSPLELTWWIILLIIFNAFFTFFLHILFFLLSTVFSGSLYMKALLFCSLVWFVKMIPLSAHALLLLSLPAGLSLIHICLSLFVYLIMSFSMPKFFELLFAIYDEEDLRLKQAAQEHRKIERARKKEDKYSIPKEEPVSTDQGINSSPESDIESNEDEEPSND